jgi:hypothetical protein
MAFRYLVASAFIGFLTAQAQLPASGVLSTADQPVFRSEIARLEKLLSSAPDKATITYVMARTFASAQQWPEAIAWLRKAADLRVGLDPSRDSAFAALRNTHEFAGIMDIVRAATPEVSLSTPAFQIQEGDLQPESLAYDPAGHRFYFGSTTKGKVVRCSSSGACIQFAGGLGKVLGLKVFGSSLWLLSNSDQQAALMQFELASGVILHKFAIDGAGHEFNDLVLGPRGDVFLTDTRAGAVLHLEKGATRLTQLPGKFEYANGITLSPDGTLLYVSAFPAGILVVDLKTHSVAPLTHRDDLCLVSIDGLYFREGSLIAIQNAIMTPRVVRLILSPDLRTAERFDVLERRNPLFDGITTGVVVSDAFFYMANIQDDKKAGFVPITILKLPL